MKRRKIFFAVISLIITILLQLFVIKVIGYDLALLIVTSLAYFIIIFATNETIYFLIKKQNIKINIYTLCMLLSGLLCIICGCFVNFGYLGIPIMILGISSLIELTVFISLLLNETKVK